MRSRATATKRCATVWIVVFAGLVYTLPAIGQSGERKPPPPAQDPAKKEQKISSPRPAKPAPREKRRSDERIRIDAPVSFPVDI